MLTAEAAMYNYRMESFYVKWLDDIADSQMPDGELPPIVPTSGGGLTGATFGWPKMRGPVPAWDAAYFVIAWEMYLHYGDDTILSRHYTGMSNYLQYLSSYADDGIVRIGLGDWMAPSGDESVVRSEPPEGASLASTAYYYRMAKIMSDAAAVLRRSKQADEWSILAERIKSSFNRSFYDARRGWYVTEEYKEFRQTNQVLPLAFGLVPEEREETVIASLVRHIEHETDGHLDTGILGTKYLLEVLTNRGYVELAYRIAVQESYPGWGYWIGCGAASLWEAWEPAARSENHHMFGTIEDWFYKYLAGIRPDAPGFRSVMIRPYFPTGLGSVQAKLETNRGEVGVSWIREGGNVRVEASIPCGMTATVALPLSLLDPLAGLNELRVGEGTHEWMVG
jgi:alpha-L-rhamnosidase